MSIEHDPDGKPYKNREVVELLPCPFCGGDAESDTMQAFRKMSNGQLSNAVSIYCTKCSASLKLCHEDYPEYDPNDLLTILRDAWNLRTDAATSELRGERDELRQQVQALEGKIKTALVDLRRVRRLLQINHMNSDALDAVVEQLGGKAEYVCPECAAVPPHHAPDCRWAKVLGGQ